MFSWLPKGLQRSRSYPIEIGYIVLSPKLSRDEYIEKCLKNNSVDIVLTDGTYYTQCLLASQILSETDGNRIAPKFPKASGELGTSVLVLFANTSNKPIVVGFLPTLENYIVLDDEDQSKSIRDNDSSNIAIVKDPKEGRFIVSITGKQENKANISVAANAKNDSAEIAFHVAGKFKHFASKLIEWISQSEFVLKVRNLSKQEKYTTIQVKLGEKAQIVDEFDNKITLDVNGVTIVSPANLNVNIEGNCTVNVNGNAEVIARGDMKIDARKISIGNAASLTLNMDTICQYTGQKHLPPPTNTKTSN